MLFIASKSHWSNFKPKACFLIRPFTLYIADSPFLRICSRSLNVTVFKCSCSSRSSSSSPSFPILSYPSLFPFTYKVVICILYQIESPLNFHEQISAEIFLVREDFKVNKKMDGFFHLGLLAGAKIHRKKVLLKLLQTT